MLGYTNIVDSETGKVLAVENSTGVVYELDGAGFPVGSIHITPEQRRAHEERKKIAEQKELRAKYLALQKDELGNFYFLNLYTNFENISPQSLTRLVYLNTYLVSDNNKLMLTQRKPMTKKDLSKVLRISPAAVSRFWNEVSPQYLTEDDKGLLLTDSGTFIRGYLPKEKDAPYMKMYVNGIRKLYQSVSTSKHKQLGYIFKMLPFVNIEYNLLCRPDDVLEKHIDDISLMTVDEFCGYIDYDTSNISKLKKIYHDIKFNINGRCERFCSFVDDGTGKRGLKVFINPRVLYSGSDYEKVEVLGAFCT